MDLVLFGMQGSGKGTQSQILADHFALQIFETGGQLRKMAQEESPLGQKVKTTIEAGHLVSSETVLEIAEDFLSQIPKDQAVLFDGIPRSMEQKELFDALLQKQGRHFIGVLIELSEEDALTRLTTRRVCPNCKKNYPVFYTGNQCESCGAELMTRKDDTPEAIRVRIDTFLKESVPVIEGYQKSGQMLRVNGDHSIEAVSQDLIELLNPYFG